MCGIARQVPHRPRGMDQRLQDARHRVVRLTRAYQKYVITSSFSGSISICQVETRRQIWSQAYEHTIQKLPMPPAPNYGMVAARDFL